MRPKILEQAEEKTRKYAVFHTEYYTLRWPTENLEKYGKKIQKLLDARKEWASPLYQEIMKRMRFIRTEEPIALDNLSYEETVLAFADAWKKKVSLREEPLQQTIEESAGRIPVHVKKKKNY